MTQPVDRKVSVNQPPANAAALVSETLAFLVAWRRILSGTGPWPTAEVDKLREQSRALQSRAKELGVGGLAHHLKTCDDCLAFEEVDRAELSRRLRNVSELTSQLRQETDPLRGSRPPPASMPSRAPAPAAAPLEPARAVESAAAPSLAPAAPKPVVASAPPVEAAPAAAPEPSAEAALAESSIPAPTEDKRESIKSEAPRFQIPRPAGSSLPPRPSGRAPVSAPRQRSPLPVAPAAEAPKARPELATPKAPETTAKALDGTTPKAPEATPSAAESITPKAPEISDKPTVTTPLEPSDPVVAPLTPQVPVELSAKTAPLTPKAPVEIAAAHAPSAPATKPPSQPTPPPLIFAPPPLTSAAEPARVPLDTLVGIKEGESEEPDASPPRPPVYVPPTAPPAPRRDVRPPELSVLASSASENAPTLVMRDIELPPDRISSPALAPLRASRAPDSVPPPSSGLDELPWQRSWSRPATRWWWLPVLGGVVAIAALFWQEIARYTPWFQSAARAPAAADMGKPIEAEPGDFGERLRELTERVHEYGSKESPELADLINREASALGRVLGQPCAGPAACQAAERARGLLSARAAPASRADTEASRALGAWLTGLALPRIGVRDVPVVQERVEFHTRYTTGRESFQVLLFQCAAHRQTVIDALLQHELPLDLMALPMAESGCLPDAETRVGARGLWQLTPEAAAAYHLEVVPELMDERISTPKASEAALRLLGDLHAKLGSWELALASYHVGPFELVTHLLRAAPETDFWQLAGGGHFGDPTTAYVGRVQAYAVILSNLEHFGFQLPEAADAGGVSELEVPAGTRLGVVARAASSSLTRLHELNPELLSDTLPELPGRSFKLLVPSDSVRRARQRLPGLIASADAPDRCVPYSFDWGRQRFTKAMAERCEHVSESEVQ